MRKLIIAANWKMNKGPAEAREFLDAFLPEAESAQCLALIPGWHYFGGSLRIETAIIFLRDCGLVYKFFVYAALN